MGLTPEEIAERAFTPSVDGYHQGEVREFLERVAAQLAALQSALPEGRVEVAELATAMRSHEPLLAQFEQQLSTAIADLCAATAQIQEAQSGAITQLVAAQQVATDQRIAADSVNQQRDANAQLAVEQRAILAQLSAEQQTMSTQLAAVQKLAQQQSDAAEYVVQAGEQVTSQLAAAQALTDQRTAATPPTATPPTATPATAPAKRDPAPALFGSDLDDQPLFSDNANDLLDGVLDDVMGNLNDEGTSS